MQTQLRKIGGSAAVVVPAALLKQLNWQTPSSLHAQVVNGTLQLQPVQPRYTLSELLAQTDFDAQPNREWLQDEAVGKECL